MNRIMLVCITAVNNISCISFVGTNSNSYAIGYTLKTEFFNARFASTANSSAYLL